MRKFISKLGTIIIFAIGILFSLLIWTYLLFVPLANNARLHRQEKELIELELPDNTQMIEKQSLCGNINGCGNGMDYLSTILIQSKLNLKDLQNYYSEYKVVEQKSINFENDCLNNGTISYHELNSIVDFNDYYVVFIYTSAELGSIWEWDLRGH